MIDSFSGVKFSVTQQQTTPSIASRLQAAMKRKPPGPPPGTPPSLSDDSSSDDDNDDSDHDMDASHGWCLLVMA